MGRARAVAEGYCSGLEDVIAAFMTAEGVDFKFEAHTLPYLVPARPAKYTPDFYLPNGIIIESKGRFLTEDRQKMVLIKKQHPALDIRLVFSNSQTPLTTQGNTRFIAWVKSTRGASFKVPSRGPMRDALKEKWFEALKAEGKRPPSQTTYADWAKKMGYPYADKLPPTAWLREPPNPSSLAALEEIINGPS